jgi:hypothetical protein
MHRVRVRDIIDDLDAIILVERAKREAAELLQRYEHELVAAGRFAEFVQLGVVRYLLTAPIDFLERLDAIRAACPEIDRVRARELLRVKLEQWRQQMETLERAVDQGDRGMEDGEGEPPEGGAGG